MDPASALADLTELSSQLEAAAIVDGDGTVVATTGGGAERVALAGAELLRVADERLGANGRTPTQVEAALRDGSLFVVRAADRTIVARTSAIPSSALVLHDLRNCLDALTADA